MPTATSEVTAAPDLGVLLIKWGPFIVKVAGRYSRSHDFDRGDFHADLVAEIVRKFPRYDPARAGFPTWVTWVLRGTLRTAMGRQSRTPRAGQLAVTCDHRSGGEYDRVNLPADPTSPDPTDRAEANDLREFVAGILGDLTPEQREAVRARFWGEDERLTPIGHVHLNDAINTLRGRLCRDRVQM